MFIFAIFKFFQTNPFSGDFFHKLKKFYLQDEWNMYDLILFTTFNIAILIRFIPLMIDVDEFSNYEIFLIARLVILTYKLLILFFNLHF